MAFDLAAAEASRMNRTANATTKRIAERESRRCRQSVISAALLRGSLAFTQRAPKRVTPGAVDMPRDRGEGRRARRVWRERVALEFARSLPLAAGSSRGPEMRGALSERASFLTFRFPSRGMSSRSIRPAVALSRRFHSPNRYIYISNLISYVRSRNVCFFLSRRGK